jgi:hypothetical protein
MGKRAKCACGRNRSAFLHLRRLLPHIWTLATGVALVVDASLSLGVLLRRVACFTQWHTRRPGWDSGLLATSGLGHFANA